MVQSIAKLPDLVVEIDGNIKLEIVDGCAKMFLYEDDRKTSLCRDDGLEFYGTLAEFFLKTHRKKEDRPNEFIEKLESQTSYDAVAEHCATELEDPEKFGWVLWEILQGDCEFLSNMEEIRENDTKLAYISTYIVRQVGVMIDENPISKGHIYIKENKILQKKCSEKIIINYREILRETNIQEYLIDLFRKSASFDELGEKLSGNSAIHIGWNALADDLRKRCKDMIRDTITPYIKKGGDKTCKV